MRRGRGDTLYESFAYWAVQGTLFSRRHPNGRYPRKLPRMRELEPAPASTGEETSRRG